MFYRNHLNTFWEGFDILVSYRQTGELDDGRDFSAQTKSGEQDTDKLTD